MTRRMRARPGSSPERKPRIASSGVEGRGIADRSYAGPEPPRRVMLPNESDPEVRLPARAVLRGFPEADHPVAVVLEGAREALIEARLVAPQPPDAIVEAQLVDPMDAARVEVVADRIHPRSRPAPGARPGSPGDPTACAGGGTARPPATRRSRGRRQPARGTRGASPRSSTRPGGRSEVPVRRSPDDVLPSSVSCPARPMALCWGTPARAGKLWRSTMNAVEAAAASSAITTIAATRRRANGRRATIQPAAPRPATGVTAGTHAEHRPDPDGPQERLLGGPERHRDARRLSARGRPGLVDRVGLGEAWHQALEGRRARAHDADPVHPAIDRVGITTSGAVKSQPAAPPEPRPESRPCP